MQYVLLVVTDTHEGRSKLIVRGDRQSGYHMDVFEKTVRELSPYKLHVSQCSCDRIHVQYKTLSYALYCSRSQQDWPLHVRMTFEV